MKYQTVREKKKQFKELALFFNNTCVRCEGASGLINVERDHIIPSYQGGADDATNYQPLCARCNSSKGPETTDHRITYATKHNLTIPKKWLPKRK
jgi:5-methylcytosine-specific restriction endonuclease McrA